MNASRTYVVAAVNPNGTVLLESSAAAKAGQVRVGEVVLLRTMRPKVEQDVDAVNAFLEARTRAPASHRERTPCGVLYRAFIAWAVATGHRAAAVMTAARFGRRMTTLRLGAEFAHGGRVYPVALVGG